MTDRKKFLRGLRDDAKSAGFEFFVDSKKGKGSHYRVTIGNRTTTVPEKISPLMAKIIRKQLGLD
jgi:hypothetical protein